VVLGGGAPPDFYVPDAQAVRLARTLLGDAEYGRHACTVARAPSPFVCRRRYDRGQTGGDVFFARASSSRLWIWPPTLDEVGRRSSFGLTICPRTSAVSGEPEPILLMAEPDTVLARAIDALGRFP